MSRISALADNGIPRPGKASEPYIGPIKRDEPHYHSDTMPHGGLSARFLKPIDTWIPPGSKGLSGVHLILGRADVLDRFGKREGLQRTPFFPAAGFLHADTPALMFSSGTSTPCGNDMIDAHVENLMDSKLPTGFPQSLGKVYDFTTIIWITASQLPTFPQGLRLLIFNILRKTSDSESASVDLRLPLWY